MKKLAYLGLFLLAACSSTSGSNAQAAAPAKDPACSAGGDCCQGAAAEKAGSCCEGKAEAKKN